jgi:uncharacterized protein YxeA
MKKITTLLMAALFSVSTAAFADHEKAADAKSDETVSTTTTTKKTEHHGHHKDTAAE